MSQRPSARLDLGLLNAVRRGVLRFPCSKNGHFLSQNLLKSAVRLAVFEDSKYRSHGATTTSQCAGGCDSSFSDTWERQEVKVSRWLRMTCQLWWHFFHSLSAKKHMFWP